MRIKHKIRQSRRDFTAVYECEHCGATGEGSGYDDANFHHNVIPSWECAECGKKADGAWSNPDVPAGLVI